MTEHRSSSPASRRAQGAAHLSLVAATSEVARPHLWFCSHCGAMPPSDAPPAPWGRVCRSCEHGLLVEVRADAAPSPGDAFLVIDGSLRVQAISAAAETVLVVDEDDVVDRPVTDLLRAADADVRGDGELANVLLGAARDDEPEPLQVTVRPADVFGVRLPARVAVCGPPRAVLLVLEGSGAAAPPAERQPARRLQLVREPAQRGWR